MENFSTPELCAKIIEAAFRNIVRQDGHEIVHITPEHLKRFEIIGKWFCGDSRKRGLFLHGQNPGTGKTTVVRAIQKMYNGMRWCVEDAVALCTAERQAEIVAEFGQAAEWCGFSPYNSVAKECIDNLDKFAQVCEEYHKEMDNWRSRFDTFVNWYTVNAVLYTARELAILAQTEGRAGLLNDEKAPAKAGVLIVDDMGDFTEMGQVKFSGRDWYGNYVSETIFPVAEIILYRYENRLPIIITSNLTLNGIAEKYGPRIADRLKEMCVIGHWDGDSYRGLE